MEQLLHQYFLQNNQLSLPGIGSFRLITLPAANDFVNQQILPPSQQVLFNNQAIEWDAQLIDYVALHKNMSASLATEEMQYYIDRLKANLAHRDALEFTGIGTLQKNEIGVLEFSRDANHLKMFAPAPAERVIREGAVHQMLVGEKETTTTAMSEMLNEEAPRKREWWWIAALVIAVVSIVMIAIK
jgi:hypothetical protein